MLSPNFNERPKGTLIDTIIIHYTGMKTAVEAIERLCNPESKVSSHYVIDEDGEITHLVPDEKRAWHSGVSFWRGRENVNDFSIGIELVNPGHEFGYRPFAIKQLESLVRLCQELIEKHPIEKRNVIGHSDIAPTRKEDPGELFDWKMISEEGIGLWPDMPGNVKDDVLLKPGDSGVKVKKLQKRLAEYGYKIEETGEYGIETAYVVTAFQRHFVPLNLGKPWGAVEEIALKQLLKQLP